MANRAHGEGTIFKRSNGTWRAQVTIGGRRLSKTCKLRKEAQDWLTTITGQVKQGLTYNSAKTSVGELLTAWLELKNTKLRQSTSEGYQRMARIYILPMMGSLKLQELTAARIQRFYTDMEERNVGRRTIELTHSVLHGFLKHAQRLGLIAQNWASLVEVPRPDRREMYTWNESEISQFLQFVKGDVFYRLALATGMRRGELIGLKWEDVDWRTSTVTVKRQVFQPEKKNRKDNNSFEFTEPKTARGRRSIQLGKGLMEALRMQYTTTIPQMQAIAGDAWQEYDLIFPSATGKPKDGNGVSKEFHELVVESGLPVIRLHDCRHTAASLMLLHGEPPVRVAAILGQTVQVLLSTYAHYCGSDMSRAANLMDEITTPTSIKIPSFVQLHPTAPETA